MSNDLTWQQIQAQIGIAGAVVITDGIATLNINLVTGKTYSDLNSDGVTEFMHKLVDACSRAETMVNASRPIQNHLASFPNSFLATPQTDETGKTTVISTQQVVTRLAQDSGEVLPYKV